jgi:hypothetical protein
MGLAYVDHAPISRVQTTSKDKVPTMLQAFRTGPVTFVSDVCSACAPSTWKNGLASAKPFSVHAERYSRSIVNKSRAIT